MTDRTDGTLAELTAELEQLVAQLMAGGHVADSLLHLAERAARHPGAGHTACRAYGNATLSFQVHCDLAGATLAVRKGAALAKRLRSMPDVAAMAVVEAGVLADKGEHAQAVGLLTELVGTGLADHLIPRHRYMLFSEIVQSCLVVDPSDSVDLCIALVHRRWSNEAAEFMNPWCVTECRARLCQWLWSSEAFKGLLHRPRFDAARRSHLLVQAREALGRAQLERMDPQLKAGFRVLDLLLEAFAASDAAKARGAAALARASPPSPVLQESARYLVSAGLLLLGQPQAARALVAETDSTNLQALPWDQRLQRLHLVSAIEFALGNTGVALEQYQAYALEASARAADMQLRMRDVVKTISRIPGARPEDVAHYFPQYLRRATDLVSADPAAWNVKSLADAVGVSDRTLRSAFEVHFGVQPRVYIQNARLERAKEYLAGHYGSDLPVAELAQRFGFSHPGRFAAAYRAKFGQSPRAARLSTP